MSCGSSKRVTVPTMPMSRDEVRECCIEGACRDFSCFSEERGWGDLEVEGEREEGVKGNEGVRGEEKSCKENRLESGGAISAEPEAANCASTTNSRRPANGDGNVACAGVGAEGKYRPVSSGGASTSSGTMATLRLSAPLSTLLLCLRLCTAALPKEVAFVPPGKGEE